MDTADGEYRDTRLIASMQRAQETASPARSWHVLQAERTFGTPRATATQPLRSQQPASGPLRRCRAPRRYRRCSHLNPDIARADLDLQRSRVACELQIAAAHYAAGAVCCDRTFPIDRPGARAGVELLIIHQRLQVEDEISRAHTRRDRVFDAGVRGTPAAQGLKAHL